MSNRNPRFHHFQPDPQTPTACIVCALGKDWHPEYQPPEARLTVEEQRAINKVRFARAIREGDQATITEMIRESNRRRPA